MAYYTRHGDGGQTRIYNKHIYDKDSTRVTAYGTVDELNAFVGALIYYLPKDSQDMKEDLESIQQDLFECCRDLSTINQDRPFNMTEVRTDWLEERIDQYAAETPKAKKFVIPGGSQPSICAHMCRTIARRAERQIVTLKREESINGAVLAYLNRLSDYFFAIARLVNAREEVQEVYYENSREVFGTGKLKEKR